MACGSGSFLVRAMTQALADCHTQAEEDEVKKHHIYGVEYDELVYGLATTNMLIHSDGNSNIVQGSCFDEVPRFIKDGVKFNVVLMNPPYNAMAKQMPKDYSKTWGKSKQDPSKGLYFVKFILDQMNKHDMQGKLAVLLPMACAIGNTTLMKKMKNAILKNNMLDAVFSLPDDIFYPGASACACCMVFDVGTPHKSANRETFFAYCKDDGFKKRKNLGRVEQMDENGNSLWATIENWKEFYVGELFDSIYKVASYHDDELTSVSIGNKNAIAYVTRTDQDNGVKSLVCDIGLANIESGNAIVIGDTTSTISYQPSPFVAGEHIIAARAGWLNKFTGLFITCLLRQERYRYSYGRAYKLDLIRNTKLKLPVMPDGKPDWQFMENYIKSLPYGDRL